ncbi:iron-containing alcohol dehydrogenase [Rhizobium sp. KVB221]|uniref:Iron-containing alcohol dehydrogenase n=1 Tax=Rhizobium setariae TaxID=2801340 RepID=A0A936YU04_9HYPH|nr:iron-containing alcohol dehydrogenase [Rhizobium setariae]MBL0374981.1 iron-containing alcohol dehydrogenase [Rhizobium setariae]
MNFSFSPVPEIRFGANEIDNIAAHAQALCDNGKAAIVIDGFLAASGLGDKVVKLLDAAGITAAIYSDFSGEPKLAHVQAATAVARGCSLVIGIGGGSALDIAKIAACTAASGEDPMHYALAANPLPEKPLGKIMIPTTAGTGSETSATNIFTGPAGKKLWVWGAKSKSDLVILDPVLTVSLPANLTAWCGLDAFVHAFEASTNRNANPAGKIFGHEALRLLSANLERAVKAPDDLAARGAVLLGSSYGGAAIDNCGTAIAHNISHAMAGLAPVHHGLATALGFEVTLPWLVEADTDDLKAAARACGLESANELPAFFSALMDRCAVIRKLPDAFAGVGAAELGHEMRATENQPMRKSTVRDVTDADIDHMAASIMAMK